MRRFRIFFLLAIVIALTISSPSQTLAHPGWAGDGITAQPWWKNAVIYEIYPRSFQDSNGDGIGDLKGITQRLDYLQDLGVDAIWLAPVLSLAAGRLRLRHLRLHRHRSAIRHPGRLRPLVPRGQPRNIRIIMDIVLNHTSDQHPWFMESESRTDPKPTGTCGATARRAACAPPGPAWPRIRRTTGSASSAAFAVEVRREDQAVLLASVLPAAARPQLAQSRSRKSHVRRRALLAQSRRRRLPSRCRHPDLRGSAVPRSPLRCREPTPTVTPTRTTRSTPTCLKSTA